MFDKSEYMTCTCVTWTTLTRASWRRRARRKSQRWLWLAGGDTAARLGSEDTATAARTQATEATAEVRAAAWAAGGGLDGGGGKTLAACPLLAARPSGDE